MRRRGAPKNRELGTFPRCWVSCSCAPVTATAMRFLVVAQSVAATDRTLSFVQPTTQQRGNKEAAWVLLRNLCYVV